MVSKPLNLTLSLLLLLLSVALVTFSLELSDQMRGQLDKNIAPHDMVVGAKGSPLQLVLSSVLHIDAPTGNIKLSETQFLQKHPFVASAIPVSYGDNFKGYRILGTTSDFLNQYNAVLLNGKLNENSFEVVVGNSVAKSLNLEIGDRFVGSHGLTSNSIESHDEHSYVVTGILKSTGTVVDQLFITNLESIWNSHDHESKEEHEHEEESMVDREVTSLLIKFKNPLGSVQLPRYVNENTSMQAAIPSYEVQRLTGLLGSGVQTIHGIALAIFLVSGLSIFISLLKTIRERKSELALLRTYGLRTYQLLCLALLEGLFLAFLGFVLGWIFGRVGIWGASQYLIDAYGYGLEIRSPLMLDFALFGLILALSTVAALLASLSIFKLNVAKTLSDA